VIPGLGDEIVFWKDVDKEEGYGGWFMVDGTIH
jgi:hypothetical protein